MVNLLQKKKKEKKNWIPQPWSVCHRSHPRASRGTEEPHLRANLDRSLSVRFTAWWRMRSVETLWRLQFRFYIIVVWGFHVIRRLEEKIKKLHDSHILSPFNLPQTLIIRQVRGRQWRSVCIHTWNKLLKTSEVNTHFKLISFHFKTLNLSLLLLWVIRNRNLLC